MVGGTFTIRNKREVNAPKTRNCFAIILDPTKNETAFLDLTGKFPYTSSRGYKYLLVIYDYDSNAILVAP